MRVFLTGGHGFIGSRVVRTLVKRGHAVRCLVRPTSNTQRIDAMCAAGTVETCEGDLLEPASLVAGMAGCDRVIHLASVSAYRDLHTERARRTIVDGTANVLRAARDAAVGRVVHVSSAVAVNGADEPAVFDETSAWQLQGRGLIYAESKHAAEGLVADAVKRHGQDVVIAIPTETYGPGDHDLLTSGYLKEAIVGWPAVAIRGGTAVAHVDDVAEGIVLALERGRTGRRYIFGTDNMEIAAIIAMALAAAGKPTKRVWMVPTGPLKFILSVLARLGLPSPEHPVAVEYGALYWFCDSTRARDELGWRPRPASQTIAETVAWLGEAGHL